MIDQVRHLHRDVVGAAACLSAFALLGGVAITPKPTTQQPTTHQPTTHQPTAQQPSGPAVDLSLKFKVGAVNRYRMAVQVDATVPALGPQPSASVYNVSVDLVEEERVNRLLPDGGAELAISTLSGKGTSNGTPFTPLPSSKPALIGFSARGDLLTVKDMPTENAGMPLLSNMFGSGALSMNGVYLPNRPVRPGETWNKKVHIAGMMGTGLATVKATYVRNGQVGSYRTARIHAVLTAPLHTLLDSNYQPTMQPGAAISVVTGSFNIAYDTDLALAEGKVVRSAGAGNVSVLIQQTDAGTKPASKIAGHQPPAAGSRTGTEQAPTKMVMKLQMGHTLIQ